LLLIWVWGPRIFIGNITELKTTADTGPRTVQATITTDNPSGAEEGIKSAEILYSIDDGLTFNSIEMEYQGNFIWSGEIPGQTPGTEIIYKIRATDIGGYSYESRSLSYKIFEVINTNILVLFNGGTEARAIQLTPYYLQGQIEHYDLWGGFGPVEKDIISVYDLVLEIHSEEGPQDDNREALRSFVNYGSRTLIVVGQETLGYLTGYEDSTFKPGDYEYDILGVSQSYNDVNYDTTKENSQQYPSLVKAVPGAYSNSLVSWVTENNVDSLLYDPYEILGSSNWMDQFNPREDINSEVWMTGLSYDGIERPIAHNYAHSNGSEIVFFSFDPLALITDSSWIGNSTINPLYQFLIYHNIRPPSVEKIDSDIPNSFSLSQNYPNPFNPTTTINYSIPNLSVILSEAKNLKDFSSEAPQNDNVSVSLKVYDILGREVATLVNQNQKPGNYKVEFDASKLTSGVYFYQLNAGDFIESKKMLLIK
jgi:hypothetical protein